MKENNPQEILQDILLKMNYDLSKTLSENIIEQSMGGFISPEYMSDPKNIKDFSKFIYEYRHGLIDIASIGAMFIPVVGPLISLGLELSNAGLYFSEDQDYSGGLALAFALIPGSELISKIPAIKKIGDKGLKSLLQKTKLKNAKYSNDELEVLKQINNNKTWIKKIVGINSVKKVIEFGLKGKPLSKIVDLMYNFGKNYPTIVNLTKMGLTIGGIWYSYDKLAQIYGLKDKPENQKQKNALSSSINTDIKIVTDFDSDWDYKEIGDKYYTKRKNTNKWILTSGKSKESIKTKVFNKQSTITKEDINKRQELEKLYNSNPNEIIKQIAPTLSSTTEEEKNKQVIEAFKKLLDSIDN